MIKGINKRMVERALKCKGTCSGVKDKLRNYVS